MVHGQRRVRLGIEAENMGRPATDPGIVAMARAIEEAGADSVSVSDHLLSFASGLEPTGDGVEETWLEALACLAAISSVTTRVRLIASVIILPQRNVLELLKTATTIDALSGGRLVLGVGSGWNAPEMAALGYDFTSRGQRMDEMLQVMRGVQGVYVPAFHGAQIDVPEGVVMAPGATSGHAIPLYIGGSGVSPVSLRRTITFGDGWMPYSPAGQFDHDALQGALSHLQEARRQLDRAPLDTVFKLSVSGHANARLEREVVELASLGFDEIIVQGIWDAGLQHGIDAIHRVRRVLDTGCPTGG